MMGIDPWTLIWIVVGLILVFTFRGLITIVLLGIGAAILAALAAAGVGIGCTAVWAWNMITGLFRK